MPIIGHLGSKINCLVTFTYDAILIMSQVRSRIFPNFLLQIESVKLERDSFSKCSSSSKIILSMTLQIVKLSNISL